MAAFETKIREQINRNILQTIAKEGTISLSTNKELQTFFEKLV
jgi:radical SAM superfamily enzyme with C-terminal helix-hairpin-helix motif